MKGPAHDWTRGGPLTIPVPRGFGKMETRSATGITTRRRVVCIQSADNSTDIGFQEAGTQDDQQKAQVKRPDLRAGQNHG